jgi:hypothetical protein
LSVCRWPKRGAHLSVGIEASLAINANLPTRIWPHEQLDHGWILHYSRIIQKLRTVHALARLTGNRDFGADLEKASNTVTVKQVGHAIVLESPKDGAPVRINVA